MGELTVLRAFRTDVPAGDELARARAMASLRAAIDGERGSTARRGLRVLLSAAVVAIAVTGLAVTWPFGGSPSVLAQASAAIGNRPVTHVVIESGLGGSLVDLRSGKRTAVYTRSESWYDPRRGLLAIVSFRGRAVRTLLLKPGANHDQDWFQTYFTGYKDELRAGAFHVTSSGVVDGTPVYWIASKPSWGVSYPYGTTVHKRVEQVAISKATYRPVYMRTQVDGHVQPASGVRILTAETVAPRPALFEKAHPYTPSGAGDSGLSTRTTLAQAEAAMGRAPLVPAGTIGALHRTWIGETGYLTGYQSYKNQLVGVELYYGSRDPNAYGTPYKPPFISITEFPHRNAFVDQQGLGYFPGNGKAVLEDKTATLKARGLYVVVTASDPVLALAGAKALISAT